MPVSSSTEHWIRPDALKINLNHFGDPDYLQVSLLAGAVVMAFKQDVISYNAAHNYRTWPLQAANTYLETSSAYHVYARLTRSEVNPSALVVYDTVLRDIEGREIIILDNGSESIGDPSLDFYFIFLGKISGSLDLGGHQVQREWDIDFRFGSLDTNQFQNEELLGEWSKMFRWNKVSDVIEVLKVFSSAIFKKLFIKDKVITDIKRTSDTDTPINDDTIPTTQFMQEYTIRKYLRKDQDDTTPHSLTIGKDLSVGEGIQAGGKVLSGEGFEVGDFLSGASGGAMYRDAENGQSIAEVDRLYVRLKAYFETLEIINVGAIGGKQILSPAGAIKCIGVEERENDFRCYFLAEQDGEKIENRFRAYDQAYSQTFNAKDGVSNKVSNTYYWRLVTRVSEDSVEFEGKQCHYIDLSKTDCDKGSDIPAVGDVINQRGSRTELDRMNFIEWSSVDANSPNITLFHGVNSYALEDKAYVAFGVDKATNKAFMNVYGDAYVGDRNGISYLRYTQEDGLVLKGKLDIETKLGDATLKDLISASTPEGYQEFVEKVTQELEGLQEQIDGAIESFFYQYDPTLGNYPASGWVSETDKAAHLNDTFTNIASGNSWRWIVNEQGVYSWKEIEDTATVKALALAGQAKDTADGKRRVFVAQPTPPYDLGDLWSGGESEYLKICKVAKSKEGVYEESDWGYADNSAAIKVEMQNLVTDTKDDLNNAIGQATEAANDYADKGIAEAKKVIDESINALNEAKANISEVYQKASADDTIEDVEKRALEAAQAEADAAIALYDTIVKAYADGTATEDELKAIEGAKAALDAAKKYAEEKANEAFQNTLTELGKFDYLKAALKEDTTIEGGLIQSSVLQLGYTDEYGNKVVMSGTNGVYDKDYGSHGGGIASWWGGGMHDLLDYYTWNGQTWEVKDGKLPPSNIPSGVIRFDGTGYFAKGAFWWDSEGEIHADPTALLLSFDAGEGDESLSQTIINIRRDTALFATMFEKKYDIYGNPYLYTALPIVTQHGITMYGDPTTLNIPSLYDGLPIDGRTIYWDNGVLKAKGGEGGGGGIADSVAWVDVYGKPAWLTDTKPVYAYSEIVNPPTIPTALSQLVNDMSFVSSSVLGGYLPLTGGTISGYLRVSGDSVTNVPLNIVTPSMGYTGYIRFGGGSSTHEIGHLGFSAQDTPAYVYGGVVKKLLHEGNYSNYALPLSGGTVSGNIALSNGYLLMYSNGKEYGYNVNGSNGEPIYFKENNWCTLLHSGNYSSYTLPIIQTTNSINSYITNAGVYRFGNKTQSELPDTDGYGNAITLYGGGDTYAQIYASYLEADGCGIFWRGDTITNNNRPWKRILDSSNYSEYALPLSGGTIVGNIDINYQNDTTKRYLRMWYYASNRKNRGMMSVDDNSVCLDYYSPTDGLCYYISIGRDGFKYLTNTVIHSGNIANYNAGSATKLATPRSLWGNSFDGSGDIWGNINLHSSKLVWNSDESNYYLSCNGTSMLTYNMYGGHVFSTSGGVERMRIDSNGNVGIGTSSPNYKLDVNGVICANGHIVFNATSDAKIGQQYTTGDTALYNYIKFNGGTNGIQYYSGLWTGDNHAAHNFYTQGSDVPRMVVMNNGNVLIGTTVDNGSKLQVNGKITSINGDEDGVFLRYENGYSGKALISIYAIGNNAYTFGQDWARFVINHNSYGDVFNILNGNVLIGTTTDSGYKLDVNGSARINGIPIYKSKDDVLYIDGNLVVRGGLTLYGTNETSSPSIFDSLPIASTSAKGIASFSSSYFTVNNGHVSLIADNVGLNEAKLGAYLTSNGYVTNGVLANYLPLSGGVINGIDSEPLIVNTAAPTSSIMFQYKGANKAQLGWDNGLGAFLTNATFGYAIGVKDDGTPYYYNNGFNTLIHSGNIGSQSVLYASSARLETIGHNLDANTNTTPIMWYYGQSSSGKENWPHGGYGGILTLATGASLDGQLVWQIQHNSTTPTSGLWWRARNNLGWGDDWKQIAFTDGNVSSATKLQDDTTFTAWGNTFFVNGKPKDVLGIAYFPNGDLIHAKDVNGTYQYVLGFTHSLALGYGSAGGGYDTYILGANIHFRYSTSRITGLTLNSSGNVGIGTTSPQYKLDVNGTFNASGAATLGSTLNVSGSSIFYGGIGVGSYAMFYNPMYAKSCLFMNADADGIYLDAASISWHGSDNAGTKTLMTFNSSGNVGISNELNVVGAATLGSTLNVSGRSVMADALTVGSSSDLAGTYKLYVNGSTRLGGLSVSGDTTLSGALFVSNSTIFNGETTHRAAAYFANGTTYYVDGSANAKFASLTSVGAVSGVNGSFSGTMSVASTSVFTGKTSHNGGIEATSGLFSNDLTTRAALSVRSTSTLTGGVTIGLVEADNEYYKLCVEGSGYMSANLLLGGSLTFYSQRSLKNVIDERGLSLEELSRIKPTRYTWRDGRDSLVHIGGIADDVEQVLPEVVRRTEDGILTMDYACAAFAISSSLIKPVSEHERRISELQNRVKELECEIEQLKNR